MIKEQLWIGNNKVEKNGPCAVFVKTFDIKNIKKATLSISAKGVYYAQLNDKRVGNFIMAPGFTEYYSRLQY